MLELKALTKEYRSKSGNSIAALKNVTLELPEKGLIFIVGKSGCGKTTLLNMIGAIDTPTSGTLSIYGRETNLNNPALADAYRSKYIGFVFQEYNLLENDTVTENIRLAGVLSHETLDVSSALEDVGWRNMRPLRKRIVRRAETAGSGSACIGKKFGSHIGG